MSGNIKGFQFNDEDAIKEQVINNKSVKNLQPQKPKKNNWIIIVIIIIILIIAGVVAKIMLTPKKSKVIISNEGVEATSETKNSSKKKNLDINMEEIISDEELNKTDEEKEQDLLEDLVKQLEEGNEEYIEEQANAEKERYEKKLGMDKEAMPIIDYEELDFTDFKEGMFNVTSCYTDEKNSNMEVYAYQRVTGSISGLQGTYTIEFPYSLGVKKGTQFPVKYKMASYDEDKDITVIIDIIVDYSKIIFPDMSLAARKSKKMYDAQLEPIIEVDDTKKIPGQKDEEKNEEE